MYDMTRIKTRYFDVKIPGGKILNVEPPKLKILKKISTLSRVKENQEMTEEDIDNLTEALSIALSKNKQNFKVMSSFIEDNYNIDEIIGFLTNYFDWVNSIQNSKN